MCGLITGVKRMSGSKHALLPEYYRHNVQPICFERTMPILKHEVLSITRLAIFIISDTLMQENRNVSGVLHGLFYYSV